MQAPASPRPADWQPPRMPKLAYRNSTPGGEFSLPASPISPVRPDAGFSGMPDAIRSSREQIAPRSGTVQDSLPNRVTPAASTLQAQRKKPSLFGGLFTKEPTLVALAQVEADLKAKHGSATPQSVPHVSSRKMPDHVPKVNTKWDGVPETVRARKGDEKERERSSKRISLQAPSTARSRSTDPSSKTRTETRDRQSTHSKAGSKPKSWEYESSDYRRSTMYERSSVQSSSLYSSISSDSLGKPEERPPSTWSQSFRSPSGTSLPEITSFFPKGDPPPTVPVRMQSMSSSKTRSTKSSGRGLHDRDRSFEYRSLPVDAIPEHSSSPINTPRERSPVTPDVDSENVSSSSVSGSAQPVRSSIAKMSSHGIPSRNQGQLRTAAFLAGEARPIELPKEDNEPEGSLELPVRKDSGYGLGRIQHDITARPHSSRARLGLRPSMVVRTDAAPWQAHSPLAADKQTPTSPRNKFPKSLGIFAR